jgi:thioesterase domain-containing protein
MRRKLYTVLRNNTKTVIVVPDNTRMIALQRGDRRPFFIVDSYPFFIDVVQLLGSDQPVVSLIAQEDTQTTETYSIAEEAAIHVRSILAYQPRGPYILGGCSASGIIAYETAQQLRAAGHEVGLLVMFDLVNPYFMREYSRFWMSLAYYQNDLSQLHWTEFPKWTMGKVGALIDRKVPGLRVKLGLSNGVSQAMEELGPLASRIRAARKYRPAPYAGRFLLVKRTGYFTGRYLHPSFGWSEVVQGKIDICKVSSIDHLEIFKSESDRISVAEALLSSFDEVSKTSWSAVRGAQTEKEPVRVNLTRDTMVRS